jgi:hypothetical protein
VQLLHESVEALMSSLHKLLAALLHPLTDCVDYCDCCRYVTFSVLKQRGLAARIKKIQEMFGDHDKLTVYLLSINPDLCLGLIL